MPHDDPSQTDTDTTAVPSPEDIVNRTINAAVSAHLKRFAEKQLPAILGPLFENALKPIQDKLAAPPVSDDGDGKSAKKDKTSPEMTAMQAKLEDALKKIEQAEQARNAAEQRARDDGARGSLKDALSPHVKPELLSVLTDHLFHQKKVVEFDEDGLPLFKSRKVDVFGAEEEVRMPLKAGVEQFLKSDDAKPFLPAPGSAASKPLPRATSAGARASTFDPNTATTAEKIRRAQEITAQAEAKGNGG